MGGKVTGEMNQDAIELVLELLQQGESLRKAAKQAKVAPSTFLLWCERDEKLAERYARARSMGADLEFDRLNDAAAELPPVNDKGQIDNGWVQWKRLQIDTMKWTLAKKRPERYGDKMEHQHTGEVALAINIDLTDDDKG